jgi:hypothetical protein
LLVEIAISRTKYARIYIEPRDTAARHEARGRMRMVKRSHAGSVFGSLGTLVLALTLRETVGPKAALADEPEARPTAIIPSTSPLAKIKEGMDSDEVTKLLGEPNSTGRHVTGKAFIPFYFGTDAVKTEWRYKHIGRVIFSKGAFTASHVSAIEYDPEESGADR